MARTTPLVRETQLTWYDEWTGKTNVTLDIKRDWQRWQEWLAGEQAFRFVAADGTGCSVRKEQRRSYGRDDKIIDVWYAYRSLAGKRRRKYIGVAENLTHERLKVVAFELSQQTLE